MTQTHDETQAEKFAVGTEWRTRGGWKAVVISHNSSFRPVLVRHENSHDVYHSSNGQKLPKPSDHDLIAPWRDTPLTWEEMTDAEKLRSAVCECVDMVDELYDSNLAERARRELLMPAVPSHLPLEPGRTYLDAGGIKRKCIHREGDTAWLVQVYGRRNVAYTWSASTGKPICLASGESRRIVGLAS